MRGLSGIVVYTPGYNISAMKHLYLSLDLHTVSCVRFLPKLRVDLNLLIL